MTLSTSCENKYINKTANPAVRDTDVAGLPDYPMSNRQCGDVVTEKCNLLYAQIMAYSLHQENDTALACMLASWVCGEGVLPEWMGLGKMEFTRMLQMHFPGFPVDSLQRPARELDAARVEERNELRQLLLNYRGSARDDKEWIATILSTACLGQNHLWQDLGLWSRQQVTELIKTNFPGLAERNDKDMKWKKFLYKQLCLADGIYVCRSPSCEVCADYDDCFGAEE